MRCRFIAVAFLSLCVTAAARNREPAAPLPDSFEIGRHTFFDFGPPTDFYEIFVVRAEESGTSIERITLTPPADACMRPAKIETASASISDSIAVLLDKNPCVIPEKSLHRELKRCKKCLIFSGVDVAMRVQCGNQTRVIRSDILDKDLFDPAPKTPPYTSWTMQLLSRLDHAVGPGVMERPIFPIEKADALTRAPTSEVLEDVGAGKYDVLFEKAPDKPSDLYRAAQKTQIASPSVELLDSLPFRPEVFIQPDYPPIARVAHLEGAVTFTVLIDGSGKALSVAVERGNPLFRGVVEKAAMSWKFPNDAAHQLIRATIEFKLNCPNKPQ